MPDGWEVFNKLDPINNDADEDPDDDGYNNKKEFEAGTDPHNADSHPSKAVSSETSNWWLWILLAIVAFIIIVVIIVVIVALVAKGKKKEETIPAPTEQPQPLTPEPQQAQPAYDPNAATQAQYAQPYGQGQPYGQAQPLAPPPPPPVGAIPPPQEQPNLMLPPPQNAQQDPYGAPVNK